MARFPFSDWLFRRNKRKVEETHRRWRRSRFVRPWFEPLEEILAPGSILNSYTAFGGGWSLLPGEGIPRPVDERNAAPHVRVIGAAGVADHDSSSPDNVGFHHARSSGTLANWQPTAVHLGTAAADGQSTAGARSQSSITSDKTENFVAGVVTMPPHFGASDLAYSPVDVNVFFPFDDPFADSGQSGRDSSSGGFADDAGSAGFSGGSGSFVLDDPAMSHITTATGTDGRYDSGTGYDSPYFPLPYSPASQWPGAGSQGAT